MTQAFNLSQLANRVNTSGQLNIATGATGTLPIANGGTGLTSVGTNGQVLSSNGTAIVWTTPTGGSVTVETFTTSGTWTKPSTGTFATILCLGGGGGGGRVENTYMEGGKGGFLIQGTFRLSDLPSTVAVTIGAGGAGTTSNTVAGANGGDTSFGSFVLARGGLGGTTSTGAGQGNPPPKTSTTVLSNLGFDMNNYFARYVNSVTGLGININDMVGGSMITQANGGYGQDAIGSNFFGGNIQNIFGTGGTGGNSSAGGNGTGFGAGGGTSRWGINGGNGTAGLCKVFVY